MAQVKKPEEIGLMRISGKIAAQALKEALLFTKPGTKTIELEDIVAKKLRRLDAKPSFTTVEDYKWSTCITINEEVVHGLPSERELESGDIVSIDTGALFRGYHSDMAITVPIGEIDSEKKKFLEVGKKTLFAAIKMASAGNRVGDISAVIQEMIETAGYSVVKSLSGHGIGKNLHEEPLVPEFGKKGTGQLLKEGMVLAIEAIYAQKSGEVFLKKDGWTISTKDGSLAGLFEQTVAITRDGPIVLTPYL